MYRLISIFTLIVCLTGMAMAGDRPVAKTPAEAAHYGSRNVAFDVADLETWLLFDPEIMKIRFDEESLEASHEDMMDASAKYRAAAQRAIQARDTIVQINKDSEKVRVSVKTQTEELQGNVRKHIDNTKSIITDSWARMEKVDSQRRSRAFHNKLTRDVSHSPPKYCRVLDVDEYITEVIAVWVPFRDTYNDVFDRYNAGKPMSYTERTWVLSPFFVNHLYSLTDLSYKRGCGNDHESGALQKKVWEQMDALHKKIEPAYQKIYVPHLEKLRSQL